MAQTVTSVITYTYDEPTHTNAIGRLTAVTETEGSTTVVRSTTFDYDVRGQITRTVKGLDGATYTTQQTYDSANRVVTLTYPDTPSPEVVTQTYDPAGNLDTVSGLKSGVTTTYVTDIQYDAFGKRTQMTLGNGTTTLYAYDAASVRLSQLATVGPGGVVLQNLGYTYDAVGNVRTIADGVSATYNETFGYDDLHRLTGATGPYGSLTYAYNPIGNMTCNSQLGPCTATSPNYAYPPSGATSVRPHAVNQAGPNTYTYDANGNMTGGAGRTLTYDVDNRPTTITAGGVTATMAYDYTGERVSKRVGATLTTYVSGLYECAGSCTKYLFAGGTRVALKTGTSVRYVHGNHLGSTHVVTDASGAKVEEIHYYPYGATYSDTGALSVSRKYTGQEFDPESGLYYYGARYYDPLLARFISADIAGVKLTIPQNLNRYSYVLNNPLRYTDPTGHFACEGFWGCIGAGLDAIGSTIVDGAKAIGSFVNDTLFGTGDFNLIGGGGTESRSGGDGRPGLLQRGTEWLIGENWGAAWGAAFTEPWTGGPTGGYLPESLANGLRDVYGSEVPLFSWTPEMGTMAPGGVQ